MKRALFSNKITEICPSCGQHVLQIRRNAGGVFKRCDCGYIEPLQKTTQVFKEVEGKVCPKCQSTLLILQHKFGLSINCSAYPECDYSQKVTPTTQTDITCPACQLGVLLEKKSRFGKVFYGCSQYPTCRFIVNHPPVQGRCLECGYTLLVRKKTDDGDVVYCANRHCGKKINTNNTDN